MDINNLKTNDRDLGEKSFSIRRKTTEKIGIDKKKIIVPPDRSRKDNPFKAYSKSGYVFFHYENKAELRALRNFCYPYPIEKTRKYKAKGKLSFLSPKGGYAIEINDFILRLNSNHFLVLSEEEFKTLFYIDK